MDGGYGFNVIRSIGVASLDPVEPVLHGLLCFGVCINRFELGQWHGKFCAAPWDDHEEFVQAVVEFRHLQNIDLSIGSQGRDGPMPPANGLEWERAFICSRSLIRQSAIPEVMLPLSP